MTNVFNQANNINRISVKPDNELYASTEYNFDLRDFALSVNEAVSTNKSFRQLLFDEVMRKFDGDFEVLVSSIADMKLTQEQDEAKFRSPNLREISFHCF
ncbi:MAG: hypothetical protein LBC68_11020 [Prevotellaceae bacterium]|jgi:hypothetical protein|nr:hypothetical protein [Prevotellaceae bacterium]